MRSEAPDDGVNEKTILAAFAHIGILKRAVRQKLRTAVVNMLMSVCVAVDVCVDVWGGL